jgi:serine/threonine protein kinase
VFCPYCFSELNEAEQICSTCGSAIAYLHLSSKTKLLGSRYEIGKILGQGGFGITYYGFDSILKRSVAIKELFPNGSTRDKNYLIPPKNIKLQEFVDIKNNFLEEARIISQFNSQNIVKIIDIFEENNTVYLVMEYLLGETLGEKLHREFSLKVHEIEKLLKNILNALKIIHEAGLLHRDIKPDNIFITKETSILIDFGSARNFVAEKTIKQTRILTPGYAPLEQYAENARFGPYTDIYSLAATMYHAILGESPPAVMDRLMGTALKNLPQNISNQLRFVIEKSLEMRIENRPSTISQFIEILERQNQSIDAQDLNFNISLTKIFDIPISLGSIKDISIDKNIQFVALASTHKTMGLLDLSSRKLKKKKLHEEYLSALSFSSEGNLLATACSNYTVALWSIPDFRKVFEFNRIGRTIDAVIISKDKLKLAICTYRSLQVLDMKNNKVVLERVYKNIKHNNFASFSNDSNSIFYLDEEGIIKYDFSLKNSRTVYGNRYNEIRCFAVNNKENQIIISLNDGRLLSMDLENEKTVFVLEDVGAFSRIIFHPSENILAAIGFQGIRFLNSTTGAEILRFQSENFSPAICIDPTWNRMVIANYFTVDVFSLDIS